MAAAVTQPVVRFAPSPNGRLHLGHAYSALLNADFARRYGGRFLLRIEDIDVTRCRPEFETAIYEDLGWLGLSWGALVRRQSEYLDAYRAAAERLKGRALLYPCICTRAQIAAEVARREAKSGQAWPRDPDGTPHYPGTCRGLSHDADRRSSADALTAWRLDMAAALREAPGPHRFTRFTTAGAEDRIDCPPDRWGDAVIVRKETPTSYHLSVVVDDAWQEVTHVLRGADLEAATGLHVLLQALLGLPSPAYSHHRLIRDGAGLKLSKSLRSEPLAVLRERGVTPAEVKNALGFPAE